MYAIYSKNQIVHIFSGAGDFIANSKKVKGEGPQEYHMAVDIKFNPYLKGIDLLSPYGTVYTYNPTFELLSKKTIKPEFYFNALIALSLDEYLFTVPSIWVNQEVTFANFRTQQLNNAGYTGTISSDNTMDKECFYERGDSLYFIPKGINYYFYRIDKEKKTLVPIIYLDFGNYEIQEKSLPGTGIGKRIGTAISKSDNERDRISKGMRERAEYLRASDAIIPLMKFFNDDFVYVLFARGEKLAGHFIYNRKKKEGYLMDNQKPFTMPPCFGIEDNVLMAIVDAYYVQRVVDTSLMSPQEIGKMEQLREEDNPVILKYYLCK